MYLATCGYQQQMALCSYSKWPGKGRNKNLDTAQKEMWTIDTLGQAN